MTAGRMQAASAEMPGLLGIVLIKWKLINGSVNKEAAGKLAASQLCCAGRFWVCCGLWHQLRVRDGWGKPSSIGRISVTLGWQKTAEKVHLIVQCVSQKKPETKKP